MSQITSGPIDTIRHQASRRAIAFLVVLTIAAIGALAWKEYDSLNSARDQVRGELRLQSLSLSSLIETSLESATQTLTGVTYRMEYNADKSKLSLDLRRRLLRSPSLTDLRAYNSHNKLQERAGLSRLGSDVLPKWAADEVAAGRSTGFGKDEDTIAFYRAARGPGGALLGTVYTTLAAEYFQSFSSQSLLSDTGESYLIGPDNTLLLNLSQQRSADQLATALQHIKKLKIEFGSHGSDIGDEDDHTFVVQQLRNQPLRVVQISANNIALAQWALGARYSLGLAVLIVLGSALFVVYLRRSEHVNQRLSADLYRMNLVIEQSPVPIVITDLNANIVDVNKAFSHSTGYGADEVLGQNPRRLQSGKTESSTYQEMWSQLVQGNSWRGMLVNKRKNDEVIWEESFIAPLRDMNGATTHYFAVKIDISERKVLEQTIRDQVLELNTILDNSSVGVSFVRDRHVVWANLRKGELFGYSVEEMKGQSTRVFYPSQASFEELGERSHAILASGDRYIVEQPMRRKDGTDTWMRLSGKLIDRTNPELGSIWIFEDITEQKRIASHLQLAASVFTHAREGIMITDASGIILDVNETFASITGYTRDEVVGKNPRLLNSGRQGRDFYATLWKSLLEKGHWYGEVWNRRKTGEIIAEMQTISAVRDEHGNIQNYVSLFSDITPMKEHQHELEHIAHYDALTQLPNRVLLADRLQQAMIQSQRRHHVLAVVFMDLDGFKNVNDTHGHATGDTLLIDVSRRMKSALREGDTLARLGGDEFVAILADLEKVKDCEPVLARMLAAASEPVTVGPHSLQVSTSMGVTFYPQDGADADLLLRQADQAMYAAKQAGKNRYCLFDVAQDSAVRERRESIDRISQALSADEFVLYYQPKVNMRTEQVVGVEALIRWQHPIRGLLAPAEFLPIVDDHPVSVLIGEWVIKTALTQMATWIEVGFTIPVSVNVGARQLQQEGFVSKLRQILATRSDVDPKHLQLEVLESNALHDINEVGEIISACHAFGVSFALDDFGTGYSSLTYLKHLPAHTLKIDQSFVRDMLEDASDLAIVNGVIGLARAFGREVIAEGVETMTHRDMLLSIGCDVAQGYGVARPMPADRLTNWIVNWQIRPHWVE